MEMKPSIFYLMHSIMCIWIVSLPNLVESSSPVYSPQNLSDASGNFAFSNATIIWASLPTGEAYQGISVNRISGGLEAFYSMVHGFITAVLPKGIPDDIVEKILEGKTSEIADNYSSYTAFFIGYAICVTIGILFMLVVPIVACCFCCCRCCCKKCGGKMVQSEEDSKKTRKKWIYIIMILIVVIFLLVGAVLILLNNDATTTAVNDIPKNTVSNLEDLEIYVNNTIMEATHLIQNNYNFLNNSMNRDLDNVAYLVGLPLRTDIETNTGIRTTLSNANSLITSLDNADIALSDVEGNETALRTAVTTMETRLNASKASLDNIFMTCGVPCQTGQPDYATAMSTGFSSSDFPDLTSPRSSMDSAKNTNMTAQLIEAEAELDNIPDTVVNDSRPTLDDVRQKISNLSNDIDPIMNQIRDLNNLFVGSNATIDLDKLSDDVLEFGDTLKKYDKYRWYGGLSLSCIVLVLIMLLAGGVTFGVLGTNTTVHPANRGCLANCGGILLMICVYLTFIISVLLMMLTTFPFMVGAPVHRMVCFPITDLDELEDLAQIYNDYKVGAGKYYLGDLVLDNDTVPLTFTGMLRSCKGGQSAFTSFKMGEKFDLTDLLNYSKTVDVQAEIDAVNVNLSSTNVYPTALRTQLSDLKDAIDINFTKFYTELQNTPTTGNLSVLADEIDTFASSLTTLPATKANLEAEATNIRNIEATEYADVQAKITALNSSVANMESVVNGIPNQVDSLDSGLNSTNAYIQSNTNAVIRNLLNNYANRLLSIADSFKAHTEDGILNKMGNCRPVWNLYDSLLVHTFCYNLMDTFNGFWFALGWCVFFSMLGLIFSVKLAKHFRRMSDMDPAEKELITSSKLFENKVYPESDPSATEGALWPPSDNAEDTTVTENFEQEPIPEFVSPLSYNKTVKNNPGHLVEMSSTKFIAKKSPVHLGTYDKSLLPIKYEGNAFSSSEIATLTESEKASGSDVLHSRINKGLKLKKPALKMKYRNNKIMQAESD